MSELALPPLSGGDRFPGFRVLDQSDHWDEATARVVAARLEPFGAPRFFTDHEVLTVTALFDQLLDQRGPTRIHVTAMVDSRLADGETDGWHYEGMQPDGQSWRLTLQWLDADAHNRQLTTFAAASNDIQAAILQKVQDLGSDDWHGVPAARIWSLWTRYACTAFYSHPWAWDEIGFPGPAYPRGYKNIGMDRREPFEVPDARPTLRDDDTP